MREQGRQLPPDGTWAGMRLGRTMTEGQTEAAPCASWRRTKQGEWVICVPPSKVEGPRRMAVAKWGGSIERENLDHLGTPFERDGEQRICANAIPRPIFGDSFQPGDRGPCAACGECDELKIAYDRPIARDWSAGPAPSAASTRSPDEGAHRREMPPSYSSTPLRRLHGP